MALDPLHQLEIIINILAQSLGGWLLAPMQALSFMGTDNFYYFILPALYWCIDARLGLRVGVILLLSNGLNSFFKLTFHAARPYWVDERVTAYAAETSFGLPSGHAQNAASVWGLLAAFARKPARKWALIALLILIGLSRLYLGVHFATDVLAGWALGGLLVWAVLRLEKPLTAWLSRFSLAMLLALALLSSLLMLALLLGYTLLQAGVPVPTAWSQMAFARTGVEIAPYGLDGPFTLAGTWLGLLGGAAWLFRRGGLQTKVTPLQLLLRYLLGLAGVLLLWFGLGQVFPRGLDPVSFALRYFRYALIGLWISALAPLLFIRLGWAKRGAPAG